MPWRDHARPGRIFPPPVRLALGAERDWDFDWTTFHVPSTEEARDACKDGGWEELGFKNQGKCIQYM